jgi:proteasome lid subunit RPN8/RPN11
MLVKCDRKVWRCFVRRALRRYPNEYMEAVWGRVLADSILICAITGVEHKATQSEIDYEPEDASEQDITKLQYLGTIHSHPDDSACHPSETDWRDALINEELLMGILAINKRKIRRRTRGVFWPQTRPLDITLQD